MARLPILEYPDPRLRTRARPVGAFTPELSRLADDLFETMYAARAIGLAATQVDVHLRLVAIDVSGRAESPELFIDPEVVETSQPGMVEESCLSLPGIVGNVGRATRVRVRAIDRDGRTYLRDLEGVLAVCLLHEIDHLDGILFTDRLSFFERLRRWPAMNRDRSQARASRRA
jgi:peptide deformylase